MSSQELKVLNSICKTKDIQPVLAANMDEMFVAYPDVWAFVKDYYSEYRAIPDSALLEEKFNFFETTEVPGETEYHVNALRESYINSELERLTLKLRDNVGKIGSQRVLTGAISDLMKLQNVSVKSKDVDITDTDAAVEGYRETRRKAELMGGVPGIPTGIDFIDAAYTGGLQGGDLIVVLGWTGRAKSLFTTLVSVNAFNKSFKPMIVSLEMSTDKVRDRAYTIMGAGQFKNTDLMAGDINEDEFNEFGAGIRKRGGFVVVSHDGNHEITPAVVQSKVDQHKPDLLVLDYAQLMTDNENSQDMVSRMRNMSKQWKRLGTANDIPVMLISSATPESTASTATAPMLEAVAWSKQLSYDADLAVAVHRHDGMIDENTVLIEIAGRKNRNGDLFAGYLKANINEGLYESFYDLEDVGGF